MMSSSYRPHQHVCIFFVSLAQEPLLPWQISTCRTNNSSYAHAHMHACIFVCMKMHCHTQVLCALLSWHICIIPIVLTMTVPSSTSSKEVQQLDREEPKEVAIVPAAPMGLPPAQPAQAADQGHGTQTSSSRKKMGTGTVCAHCQNVNK